jgi:Na+/proline symporter
VSAHLANPLLLGVLAYVAMQLVLGLVVSRWVSNETDYWLAGRQLGPSLAMFSVFATWFGAETCIGASGAAYAQGVRGATADPFGYAACLLLMGVVFAAPLRRRGLTTLADLFRDRYCVRVERLAAVLMIPSSLLWAAAQIRAFGSVIATVSDLDASLAITFAAAVVVIYTASGGLLADAVTDLLQGIVLLVGLGAIAAVVMSQLGGPMAFLAAVEPAGLAFDPVGEVALLDRLEAWAVPIFGSVVAQELVARVVAVRSPELARRATVAASGLYFAVGIVPVSLGLVGASLLPGLDDPEQILPRMAQHALPTVGYVLFAGALVSAILSTVDSALLAASSLACHNVIVPLRPQLSDRARLRLARSCVTAFGVVAYAIALRADGVLALVETASAFASAGIFVIVAFGLFTPLGGPVSAAVALLVGAVTWLIAHHVDLVATPYLLSLVAATLSYLAVAWIEPKPREEIGA